MFKKISETQVKSVVKRKRVYVLARDTVYIQKKKWSQFECHHI